MHAAKATHEPTGIHFFVTQERPRVDHALAIDVQEIFVVGAMLSWLQGCRLTVNWPSTEVEGIRFESSGFDSSINWPHTSIRIPNYKAGSYSILLGVYVRS